MGVNPEQNAKQKEATRKAILTAGFRIFAENTIERVKMTDVADAAKIGVATVYRHYGTKADLVLAISSWIWGRYVTDIVQKASEETNAAEQLSYFLDSFLDLYRNHKDMLRFNQFFNVYVESEDISEESMKPFKDVIVRIIERFHMIYQKALVDHTVRTDIEEKEMFSECLHLMLAAVTRYAVGLVYDAGVDPEKELMLLKALLMREFTTQGC